MLRPVFPLQHPKGPVFEERMAAINDRLNDREFKTFDEILAERGIDLSKLNERHQLTPFVPGRRLDSSLSVPRPVDIMDRVPVAAPSWQSSRPDNQRAFGGTEGKISFVQRADNLVQAMATFDPPAANLTGINVPDQQNSQPALAVNWR